VRKADAACLCNPCLRKPTKYVVHQPVWLRTALTEQFRRARPARRTDGRYFWLAGIGFLLIAMCKGGRGSCASLAVGPASTCISMSSCAVDAPVSTIRVATCIGRCRAFIVLGGCGAGSASTRGSSRPYPSVRAITSASIKLLTRSGFGTRARWPSERHQSRP